MTLFQCTVCKYKMNKDKAPNRCPYCSKEGAMIKPKSAQDMIEESF
ncbi:MAG: rubredoxin-like domain-containing protein [Nanoarchaeota archaeon]